MNEKNINSSAGHRSRVKARYKAEGLDNFKDFHALELLLWGCPPFGFSDFKIPDNWANGNIQT